MGHEVTQPYSATELEYFRLERAAQRKAFLARFEMSVFVQLEGMQCTGIETSRPSHFTGSLVSTFEDEALGRKISITNYYGTETEYGLYRSLSVESSDVKMDLSYDRSGSFRLVAHEGTQTAEVTSNMVPVDESFYEGALPDNPSYTRLDHPFIQRVGDTLGLKGTFFPQV